MKIHDVYGHEALVNRLGGAIASGRFPQSALMVGPAGVGKQRLALWCAQTLLCEAGGVEPCRTCPPCVQAGGLAHPDLHWFVPLTIKKKQSTRDKQVEEVQAALADVMADRRARPLYAAPEPTASHAVASVRYLQRIVAKKPFQGHRKVIILGDAPRLVVQEASQEAANALLKVLEEPPLDTILILTAQSAHSLLPTIRSRTVPIRVQPIADRCVEAFAADVLGGSDRDAVARAGGRIGALITQPGGPTAKTADGLLGSLKKGPAARYTQALKQAPWGARGGFSELLDALSQRMRTEMERRSGGNSEKIVKPLRALQLIDKHRENVARNVNPQLALAVLARELGELT